MYGFLINKKYMFLLSLLTAILGTIILSISIFSNHFNVADQSVFSEWQLDSQNLVENKIFESRTEGIHKNAGLLPGYPQQVGLQGIFFSFFDRFLLFPDNIVRLAEFLNSLMLSVMCMLCCIWAKREFGYISGFTCYLACFFSPWLIISGRNLYWSMFTMLMPFIIILFIVQHNKGEYEMKQTRILFLVAFFTCLIRFCLGFEYTSTVLISAEIPIIFYALDRSWSFEKWLKMSFIIGIAGLSAFATAFLINISQQTLIFGSLSSAFSNILYTISKRTGAFGIPVAEVYQNSLNTPLSSLLYSTIFKDSIVSFLNLPYLIIITFFVAFSGLLATKFIKNSNAYRMRLKAISLTVLVSLLAPFSWFFLAKGHTIIHPYVVVSIVYYPYILFLFCVLGYYLHWGLRLFVTSVKAKFIVH